MQVEQPVWPPLPGGAPPPLPGGPAHYQQYEPPRYDQQPPWQAQAGGFPAPPHLEQPGQGQGKRKKRGRRGSGLEARQRGLKRQQQHPQPPPTALGFFGQVPASLQNVPASLQDLRRENRARAAQHFGGGGRAQQQHGAHPAVVAWWPAPALPPAALPCMRPPLSGPRSMPLARRSRNPRTGPGRAGGHRRSRGSKASKLPKRLAPTPRPMPLTPAGGCCLVVSMLQCVEPACRALLL